MIVDTKLIKWLLANETQTNISKHTNVLQPTLSRLKNGIREIDTLTIKTGAALTEYAKILKGEIKMNVYKIENVDYIWDFDQLSSYLDEDDNFKDNEEFYWWEELADSIAYLEEVKEIDTRDLEVNELQDYIDMAEEQGF
jgi:hypothetical protein